jgi:hypothetical protein
LVQAIRDIYNYFYDLTGERYTKTYLCEAYKIFLPGENVKHDPITFSETYSDEYSHHSRGFKAYRNEKGERIHALQVVLEARTWNKGFCLVLSIIEHYSSVVIIDEKTNTIRAKITTAKNLSAGERKKIEEDIKQKYKGEVIISEFFEKKELLGGMRVEVGSEVLDTTFRTRLRKLEKFLIK